MNTDTLWKTVLAELELTITPAVFKTAFAKSRLLSLDNQVATIGIANPMMRQMVETRYYSLVKSIVDHHTKANVSLIFTILQRTDVLADEEVGPLFTPQPKQSGIDFSTLARKLHLRADSTFDKFAVSPTNQIAYAAATAVSKSPGTAYNPLFFYGGVGVGKTHLMHAVANDLLRNKPNLRVVYCMGEEFLNEIVEAIQTKTSRQFKQKYRSAQLLLVDDVQFIAGKQTAQEEFFHTFNAVHREGGQIILTSDRPPYEIAKLEDRLRSRFEGGLTVDVAAPDFELRVAIINIKSEALNINIPNDAAHLIASTITDTRAIEGFLRKLMNDMAIHQTAISKELVAKLLKISLPKDPQIPYSLNGEKKSTKVSPSDVLDAVATFFEIKTMHLKGPKRDRPLARPRQLVMYLCMTELNVTLDDVGGLLGGRDHTTVMHGVDKIKLELETDARLREALASIKSSLFPQS